MRQLFQRCPGHLAPLRHTLSLMVTLPTLSPRLGSGVRLPSARVESLQVSAHERWGQMPPDRKYVLETDKILEAVCQSGEVVAAAPRDEVAASSCCGRNVREL